MDNLTSKIDGVGASVRVEVLSWVSCERVEVLRVVRLVVLWLVLGLVVLVLLRRVRLVRELRCLVVDLVLGPEVLREGLRGLVEEVGLLRVDWGGEPSLLGLVVLLRLVGLLLVLGLRLRLGADAGLVELPQGSGSAGGLAVVLRVLVDPGVLAVLAVVLLAVGEGVGGVVIQGRGRDHDAGSWK